MNMHRLKTIALAAAVSVVALASAQVYAAKDQKAAEPEEAAPVQIPTVPVSAVLKVGQAKTEAAQQSQKAIDKLASETTDLLQDYRAVLKQIEGLKVYNSRLERQIANQIKRIKDLEGAIDDATVVQRQMTPLIIRMIDGLEQFVALDVPFHIDERRQRIEFLRNNLDRSDVTVAEKFRQVLEAYKIENEYGRKLDTYKGTVPIEGQDRDVNFLRIGRIALMYQTTDGEQSGVWDQSARQYVELDSSYRGAITKGLRIARKQASIDIMKIPVSAPEAAQQ